LSRWCAPVVSDNALADFAIAPRWAQDGMPDWVDRTDPTDQNANSIGCGMAFSSWLLSSGVSLELIAQSMVHLGAGKTLADLYAMVTGEEPTRAWPAFKVAITRLAGGVTSDDPLARDCAGFDVSGLSHVLAAPATVPPTL